MNNVALELNDASLAVAGNGNAWLAGPGYAVVDGGALRFGEAARPGLRLNPRGSWRRYWADLDESALPVALGACRTAADLVQAHLRELWARCAGAGGAVLAVTPGWSEAQLGLLLGLAADAGIPVTGLADSAVAASRRPCAGGSLLHVEATLGHAWITRLVQDGPAVALGARDRLERLGIEALERGVAEFVAGCFVARSRFDPLRHAASEQQLYDNLPAWLGRAAREERVAASLEFGGNRFEAEFDATGLRAHLATLCEPLIQRLRAIVSPREPAVLQLHGRLGDFPGVVEALLALPGCTVVMLEPGAAARGALRLPGRSDAAAGLHLATRLPFDQPAYAIPATAPGQTLPAPTHVVFRGRAWRLADGPVAIGASPGEARGIRIDAPQGVSRRHCVIQAEDGGVVLYDQSRFGTWLNGHRVEGSAMLQAGDVVGIGQPPGELTLVVEVGDGA